MKGHGSWDIYGGTRGLLICFRRDMGPVIYVGGREVHDMCSVKGQNTCSNHMVWVGREVS